MVGGGGGAGDWEPGMGSSVCVWPDFALPSPDPDLSSLFHGSWYGTDVTFLGTKLQ